MTTTGDLRPTAPALRWRQRSLPRMLVGGLVTTTLVTVVFLSLCTSIFISSWAGGYLLGGNALVLGPPLVLAPFLRRVSYRKRDVVLLLLPIYGQFLCGVVVSRLMALPRRDWDPRPDERPRAVALPDSGGAWLLARSFSEAETRRVESCRNARHQHPYEREASAPLIGCQPAPLA